jgi:hypothetical protein
MYTWIVETPDGIKHEVTGETIFDAVIVLIEEYMEKDIYLDESNIKILSKK